MGIDNSCCLTTTYRIKAAIDRATKDCWYANLKSVNALFLDIRIYTFTARRLLGALGLPVIFLRSIKN
jgi:hypothetical protein